MIILFVFFDGYYKPHAGTVGSEWRRYILSIHSQDFPVSVWSSCPLPRFETIVKHELQMADAILIFAPLESRKMFIACVDKYIPMIKDSAPTAIIILIGINLDLRTKNSNTAISESEAMDIAYQHNMDGYFECSARTGEGLEDAFKGALEIAAEKRGLWLWLGKKYIPSAHARANKLTVRSTYNQVNVTLQSNKQQKIKEEKSFVASYKHIDGQEEDFHYVYLEGAINSAIQKIIKGKYGLDSASYKADTYAEGNERQPLQIGFTTKDAADKFLKKLKSEVGKKQKFIAHSLKEKIKTSVASIAQSSKQYLSSEKALKGKDSQQNLNESIAEELVTSQGKLDEALKNFDKTITLDPNSADNWTKRSAILFELGRHEEALASIEKALSIDPGYTPAQKVKAFGKALMEFATHAVQEEPKEQSKCRIS
jgi:tetratricopeptide (TPR) repeat protein